MSAPASELTVSVSFAGSASAMLTVAASPVTVAEPLLPATLIASGPLVPFTTT